MTDDRSDFDAPRDAGLVRLFAAAQERLPAEPFVASVRSGLRRHHRLRSLRRSAVALVVLGAVALVSVPLLPLSIGIAQALVSVMVRFAQQVSSPLGASLALAVCLVVLQGLRGRLRR